MFPGHCIGEPRVSLSNLVKVYFWKKRSEQSTVIKPKISEYHHLNILIFFMYWYCFRNGCFHVMWATTRHNRHNKLTGTDTSDILDGWKRTLQSLLAIGLHDNSPQQFPSCYFLLCQYLFFLLHFCNWRALC